MFAAIRAATGSCSIAMASSISALSAKAVRFCIEVPNAMQLLADEVIE
jgi:hypothetical protein